MAKEKLLFPIIMLVLFINPIFAQTPIEAKESNQDSNLELANLLDIAKQATWQEIKQKWLELQIMLAKGKSDNESNNQPSTNLTDQSFDIESMSKENEDNTQSNVQLRIFVSNSMSKNLLKTYAAASKKYKAILVFNGLPENSWNKLLELVTEISGDDPHNIAMQIDDEAFRQFDIISVPSFVLAKEENIFSEHPVVTFDKITGSISITRALELFSSNGQLADIARNMLELKSEILK